MPTIIPPKEKGNNPSGNPDNPKSGGLFSRSKEERISFKEKDPRWCIDEIILDQNTREEIGDIIYFCQHQKELIEKYGLDNFLKGRASVGINLYGEPGTGKSITTEAIAKAMGKKVIEVNYSEVQSDKWGGTEKLLVVCEYIGKYGKPFELVDLLAMKESAFEHNVVFNH